MTTIAWDGKTLAADSQRNTGNGSRIVKKIRTDLGDTNWVAFGAAGDIIDIEKIYNWIRSGSPEDKNPSRVDVDAILIDKRGEAWRVSGDESGTTIWSLKDQIDAVGTGGNYALGAMAAGADAEDAVKIAIYYDSHSGSNVETFTFKKNSR